MQVFTEWAGRNHMGDTNIVKAVRFAPDGTCLLSSSEDCLLRLFEVRVIPMYVYLKCGALRLHGPASFAMTDATTAAVGTVRLEPLPDVSGRRDHL